MKLILLMTVLSGWDYEGFVSDPEDAKNVVPRSATASTAPKPSAKEKEAVARADGPPGEEGMRSRVAKLIGRGGSGGKEGRTQSPPSRDVAPASTVWRLTDAFGQAWDHADPNFLAEWVASRNATLVQSRAVVTPPFVYRGTAACSTGRCVSAR